MHKTILQMEKFHDAPVVFNSAEKALYFINESANINPIILFLDINMPVMNGWDLLDMMEKERSDKEVYVVIVTSSVDVKDREKAFSYSRVVDFVEKPFDTDVLERLKGILPVF
jgi:CheY-like chemotaxis protein